MPASGRPLRAQRTAPQFASDQRNAQLTVSVSIGMLVLATISRALVSFGAPSVIDFVHIPIVLCLAAQSVQFARRSRICRRAWLWLAVLLVVAEASWIGAGGEFVRPLAAWVLLSEPLLFAIALSAALISMTASMRAEMARRIELTVVALAAVQLPFALRQLLTKGVGDPVEGTFIKLGSGAHVVGALEFVGALALASILVRQRHIRRVWWALVVIFILMVVATDAKQVLVAAVPAVLTFVCLADAGSGIRRVERRAKLVILGGAGVLFAVIFVTYGPLHSAGSETNLSYGSAGKLDAARLIVDNMNNRPESFLVGLGPGDTVSKLATLTKGADLRADSPVGFLELSQSPLTQQIREQDKANYILASSSVFSGLSSMIGLFGDLGLLGTLAYGMAWYALVRPALRSRGNPRSVIAAAIVATVILSYVNVWLEEPNFMLPLAALVVAAVARSTLAAQSNVS
jgi:hypothetical protein